MTAWIRQTTNGMLRSHRVLALALVAAGAATGCATAFEGKYPFNEGWRRGTVVSVVPGAQLTRTDYWECTRKVPAAARSTKTYAVVRLATAKFPRYFAADIDPSVSSITAGTPVYVNVFDCQQPLVAREPITHL